jgi:hypothetical protein
MKLFKDLFIVYLILVSFVCECQKKSVQKENDIWEQKIEDFEPESIITVEVEGKKSTNLYEEVTVVPTKIQVAYYLHDDTSKIDFEVVGPNNQKRKKYTAKNRDFIEIEAKVEGVYRFVIKNDRFKYTKKVTFAIHTGENVEKKIQLDNLQGIYETLSKADLKMKDIHFNQQMLNRKAENHFNSTKAHNTDITQFTFIETTIMVMILVFQFFYIRNLTEKSI